MSRLNYIHTHLDAFLTSPTYPNARVSCADANTNPYNETIMSMPSVMAEETPCAQPIERTLGKRVEGSYFFFLFNFENYYHFLYDTLPYLHHYFQVRTQDPACKLLLPACHTWLQFQRDCFDMLDIEDAAIAYAEEGTTYEKLYVPSSLTHGIIPAALQATSLCEVMLSSASNLPPSPEAYTVWNALGAATSESVESPKKIYISRRTHLLADTSNVGTNYTTRRRCLNEDALVELLKSHGYVEIFCESMSMSEKISMFRCATHVAGFIGGGMANLLFSPPSTKVLCIVTPYFLDINTRFKFSMGHTDITYADSTSLAPHDGPYPLYTRARINLPGTPHHGAIGEIDSWVDDYRMYIVKVPKERVAGFSLTNEYARIFYSAEALEPLDKGLNSPFVCDIDGLKPFLNN